MGSGWRAQTDVGVFDERRFLLKMTRAATMTLGLACASSKWTAGGELYMTISTIEWAGNGIQDARPGAVL